MKIAFYMEDGIEQVVLTPQSDTERKMLAKLHDGSRDFSILRGNFYECQGGWLRQGLISSGPYGQGEHDDSTIFVLRPKKG